MIRQRTKLGPNKSEPIPIVYAKSRTLHPILFRKRLSRIEDARPGDLTAVYAEGYHSPMGYGLYNPRSEMALRMLWNSPEMPDDAAWAQKLSTAVSLRLSLIHI